MEATCFPLIVNYSKGAKIINWVTEILSKGIGKPCKRIKLDHLFISWIKVDSKRMKDFDARPQIIKWT